ncbi:ATP-binding protein [candidate division KSB1 bacterium]|nr:ATP-binding protein [candidate division KSB1 bacterium]
MQKLPVGLSDFKQVIEGHYYYVDKSLLLKELIDHGAQAMLIPRPRRFGKTLNLSMMRYFFEKTDADTSHLFRHLKIWQAGEEYTSRQAKYPVIFLTFKDVKEFNWVSALEKIKQLIQTEFLRHKYLRNGKVLEAEELDAFDKIANLTASTSAYENSLEHLSDFLARYHHQPVILLIDEYDTPIQAGYVNGYYAEVVGFMRNFLSGGLKDNPHLEKGVLTGILRVAKESIFSGLNNLAVFTLLRSEFSAAFGLTEAEVEQALRDFQVAEQYDNIRNWYNGYIFGGQILYNPWSIINYLASADKEFLPYWVNTSDNALIEQVLTRGGIELKAELESLIRGESIEKPVQENIVYRDIEKKEDLLWSFLLFSGYLKSEAQRRDDFDPAKILCQLVIPNQEVRSIYISIVEQWFSQKFEPAKLAMMLRALCAGDIESFELLFREMVAQIFSFHNFGAASEKVYQAFAIGLLVWLGGQYDLKSDRESGYGRYDVMLIPRDSHAAGIIIEFKKVNTKRGETKDRAFAKAFQQIEEKNYAAELEQRGIQQIRKLAVVFKGKQVWVREQSAESRGHSDE